MPETDNTPSTPARHPASFRSSGTPPAPADSFWHARRADARAILRGTPTSLLLSDLADLRADSARPIPPLWWLDAVIQAGRIRAALRERKENAR